MVEGARLESVYTSKGYQGFESLTLRNFVVAVLKLLLQYSYISDHIMSSIFNLGKSKKSNHA